MKNALAKIDSLLELPSDVPIVDVRAPIEFAAGHIPGAINVPLFDDEERSQIGTAYRQQGNQYATLLGLEFVGPKMRSLPTSILKLTRHQGRNPRIGLYCWRGGQRSRSVQWLLEQVGIEVVRLEGGYKSFRSLAQSTFRQPYNFVVLSGLTGAGKTRQLKLLEKAGQQILDLEGIANHRGSAFGGIGQGEQPSTEQFENLLALKLRSFEPGRRIWVEDESKKVGRCVIPHPLFRQINGGQGLFMEVARETRSHILHEDYGDLDVKEMTAAIGRITKKLGGQNTQLATAAIESGDLKRCCNILLDYYDRLYLKATSRGEREISHSVEIADPELPSATQILIDKADQIYPELISQSGSP